MAQLTSPGKTLYGLVIASRIGKYRDWNIAKTAKFNFAIQATVLTTLRTSECRITLRDRVIWPIFWQFPISNNVTNLANCVRKNASFFVCKSTERIWNCIPTKSFYFTRKKCARVTKSKLAFQIVILNSYRVFALYDWALVVCNKIIFEDDLSQKCALRNEMFCKHIKSKPKTRLQILFLQKSNEVHWNISFFQFSIFSSPADQCSIKWSICGPCANTWRKNVFDRTNDEMNFLKCLLCQRSLFVSATKQR